MISKWGSTLGYVQNRVKPKIPLIYIAVASTNQQRLKTRPKSLTSRFSQLQTSSAPTRMSSWMFVVQQDKKENLLRQFTELGTLCLNCTPKFEVAPRGR